MSGAIQKLQLVVSNEAGSEWADWLKKLNGNIYHSTQWAETRRTATSRPLFFRWLDGSNSTCGIAVGIENWSPFPVVGKHSKHLELGTFPAAGSFKDCFVQDLIAQLLDYSRNAGHSSLVVQSYYADSRCLKSDQQGFEAAHRLEFVIDLTLPEEQLWRNLKTNHRRKIGKARKYDLKFENASDLEAMRQFRRLQVQSRDRRHNRGEHIGTIDDSYYERFGRAYFERDLGQVCFMTHQDTAVSGAFVSIYAGKAYYVFGGSSDEGFSMDAPALLFWEIFSHCRKLGCHEFNMGGVPSAAIDKEAQSHGLYRFKAGFGGQQVPCTSLTAENLQPRRDWLTKMARKVLRGR